MSPDERINDELLVLRSQAGDPTAFEALVERWQARLWRHAWRLTGDEDAAWDVLQEAWLGISRGIGRLEDAAVFPTWAYQVVGNKCRDWIRREARRRGLKRTLRQNLASEQRETAARRQRRDTVQDALARLGPDDRALLGLRYEARLGMAEIAEVLRVPEGTVKSRLHHARNRLREIMKEPEP